VDPKELEKEIKVAMVSLKELQPFHDRAAAFSSREVGGARGCGPSFLGVEARDLEQVNERLEGAPGGHANGMKL
jgi:hypothetical protein